MKLFHKIYILTSSVMMTMFAFFGSGILQTSFCRTMDYELAQGYSKQQTFHISFASYLSGMYQKQPDDEHILSIAYIVQNQISDVKFLILRSDGTLISMENEMVCIELLEELQRNNKRIAYQIIENDGQHQLIYMSQMEVGNKTIYVQSIQGIERLYQEQEELYHTYYVFLILALLIGGVLLYFISHFLTKDIEQLSEMTKHFSEGNYSERFEICSDDEVGKLAFDFNTMAEQLEKNIYELQQSLKQQEEFTSAFSHELKTPMTSIIGYADMLRSMKLSEEEIAECANYIYLQGKRLESLSKSMLSMFCISQEKLSFCPISIAWAVEMAVVGMQPVMNKINIYCSRHISDGYIMGNSDLIVHLIMNLLDNAVKASLKGAKIEILGSVHDTEYILQICDYGCGIPAEHLNQVTNPFYMVDKSRDRKKGGHGLGLSLVKHIVEVHHGSMEIQSQVDSGTTVKLHFPLVSEKGGIVDEDK